MKITEEMWKLFQEHLGYTDEEMKLFRKNPRNEDVLAKAPALMNKTIIAEIVETHGCNSQHKVGDKFYFDGAGNLITKTLSKENMRLRTGSGSIFNLYLKRIVLCRS